MTNIAWYCLSSTCQHYCVSPLFVWHFSFSVWSLPLRHMCLRCAKPYNRQHLGVFVCIKCYSRSSSSKLLAVSSQILTLCAFYSCSLHSLFLCSVFRLCGWKHSSHCWPRQQKPFDGVNCMVTFEPPTPGPPADHLNDSSHISAVCSSQDVCFHDEDPHSSTITVFLAEHRHLCFSIRWVNWMQHIYLSNISHFIMIL